MPLTEPRSRRESLLRFGLTAHPSEESATLFTYGSLQYAEVLQALLGRVPRLVPATAAGWRVACLPDRVYPALVPGPHEAKGSLLLDLSDEEWHVIDAFEDDVYDLRHLDTLSHMRAWAYVCSDSSTALADNWDGDLFADEELQAYVVNCARWRETI